MIDYHNMKKFLSAVLGISTLIIPTNSLAVEQRMDITDQLNHRYLIESLNNVGVDVVFNAPVCESDIQGAYFTDKDAKTYILICQDNVKFFNGVETDNWTANDYDTLRHEAHHVVQDCAKGKLGDYKSERMFTGALFQEYVINNLPQEKREHIYSMYSKEGASDEVILQEFEAFAVADNVSASTIADKVTEWCSY